MECFNDYFINIGNVLARALPMVPFQEEPVGCVRSFFLNPVTQREVQDIIGCLYLKKACGADNIKVRDLKELKLQCSSLLAWLINM